MAPSDEQSRRLLSIAGAARQLGLSASGVRRLIRSGQLPAIEVGDAMRIPLRTIDRLVSVPAESGDAGAGRKPRQGDFGAMLDELRMGQAQLLEEVTKLREELAGLAHEHEAEPAEALLTVKDVADLLRVSRSVVYGWSGGNDGPPVTRVGRSLRFRRRDALAWLDALRQEPTNWRVEATGESRMETARRLRVAQVRADRPKANAAGLIDNVALALILDIPVATVDGWRLTGRGPRWARIGGVVRYRVDYVRNWVVAEREFQSNRNDRRYRHIDCDEALSRLEDRLLRASPR